MHGSRESVRALMRALRDGLQAPPRAEVAVFPTFVHLPEVAALAGDDLAYGAQTLSEHDEGAHTGEISGPMLADFGCRYVLVGHSERRTLYHETNAQVADKFQAAQRHGLMPILCLGESLAQRDAGETEAIVRGQLDAVLREAGIDGFKQAVIAYEPVWAIGTGKTAGPEEAQSVHGYIREKLSRLDGTIAGQVRILYGGSVKPANAGGLFVMPDIDGALVGGASLKPEEFLRIVRAAD